MGIALSKWNVKLHAYGVCDDPDYFYSTVKTLFKELGAGGGLDGQSMEAYFKAIQAKGAGYAISKPEELQLIQVSHTAMTQLCIH